MPIVPVPVEGRTRLIALAPGGTAEDAAQRVDEQARVDTIVRARTFYEGTQYDDANTLRARECAPQGRVELMPEHERLHTYSTHVAESIDFVADQLSSGFSVEASDPAVQEIMDAAYAATDVLTADADQSEDEQDDDVEDDGDDVDTDVTVTCDTVLRDALVGSDVPYEVKWNPFAGECYYEFWESEEVEFVVPTGNLVTKVIRRASIWVDFQEGGQIVRKEVEERVEYSLQPNEVGKRECVRETYWDAEENPREVQWLGLPIIPWGLLRSGLGGIRAFRGKSFITQQVMDAVRRFDALEQYGFQIARYNSHGNLVTVGDESAMQIANNGGVKKDVADVVSFPANTKAFALQLPTDPQMIEHQRKVLEESIYKKFGLTRVEPDTLEDLGSVSGYALEILNRKSAGTLNRIARQFKKDWKALVSLTVDVYAYRQGATVALDEDGDIYEIDLDDPEFELEPGSLPLIAFWDIDPSEEYGDRTVAITMGTGYIVDDVAIRDDFTAKLISQQEALRKRGYTAPQITRIMSEQKESSPTEGQISDAARRIADRGTDDTDDDDTSDSGTGRGTLDSTDRDTGGTDE